MIICSGIYNLIGLENKMPVDKQDKNLLAVPPFSRLIIYTDNNENTIIHIPLGCFTS